MISDSPRMVLDNESSAYRSTPPTPSAVHVEWRTYRSRGHEYREPVIAFTEPGFGGHRFERAYRASQLTRLRRIRLGWIVESVEQWGDESRAVAESRRVLARLDKWIAMLAETRAAGEGI